MTRPMTPEELSALADKIAGISRGKARIYFLVPKRQQLPPLSEELEPGSVRFLGAVALPKRSTLTSSPWGCSSCLSAWCAPG